MTEINHTKIFADGAHMEGILKLVKDPVIKGFTTNPTLMRKAGISNYVKFSRELLETVTEHPISFEVFADDPDTMRLQAHEISGWAENVYVKIPVTDSSGESMAPLITELSESGVKVNVTALLSLEQVETVTEALQNGGPSYISLFAGRAADTGVDPVPLMKDALKIRQAAPNAELIWASPREVLNIVQADSIGCDIITVTHDLLGKLALLGKSLEQFSLETVQMFRDDALEASYEIPIVSSALKSGF